MNNKFQNKYRIPSARCKNWDYTNDAAYFITICTQNRHHYFGKIIDGEMYLSDTGKIANEFWSEIPKHFPFVELGNFVIMPNHIHGILILNKPVETLHCNVSNPNENNDALHCNVENIQTLQCNVSTEKNDMGKISPKSGSVSVIVRSFKSAVTKISKKTNPDFGWQSRFYDHVIRDAVSFENIRNYIDQNPLKWKEDSFFGTE